jgi:hypothetical protein
MGNGVECSGVGWGSGTDCMCLIRMSKQVMEEKINHRNVQMAIVTREGGFQMKTREELQVVLSRVEAVVDVEAGGE